MKIFAFFLIFVLFSVLFTQEAADVVSKKTIEHIEGLKENPQLEVIPLATGQDVFVGGPNYRGAGFFDQGRLLNEPMLLLQQGTASRTFFDAVTHGACRKPRFELGSIDVLLDLVEINMGISMLPSIVVNNRRHCGED